MFVAKENSFIVTFLEVPLFWSKQATNSLKTIKSFLLLVQFHNVPSNFANLAAGETGEPTTCFKIIGKEILFSPDNDAKKNRLQDFYDIFHLHV